MAKFEYGLQLRNMLTKRVSAIGVLAREMVMSIDKKPSYADVQVLEEMLHSATDTLKRMKQAEYPQGVAYYARDLGPEFEQDLAETEHALKLLSLMYGPKQEAE